MSTIICCCPIFTHRKVEGNCALHQPIQTATNVPLLDLVQSKRIQKGLCNRCCVTAPIVTLPSFCLCCWNLNWIMSWASSCYSAVPARPQSCVPCWGKSGAGCSSAAVPHQLCALGLALSQPKSVLIHVHSKGQQLWQCLIRAQRGHVYRKSWLH